MVGCGELHPVLNVSDNVEFDLDTEGISTESARYWEAKHYAGNVKSKLKENWPIGQKCLKAAGPILEIVQHGYKLPLIAIPNRYIAANHKSTMLNI